METQIALFRGKKIRKIIYKNEWWFSVVDIVEVLTGSSIPRRYWTDLKRNLKKEGFGEVYEKIVQLKLVAPDGKMRETDCGNTETLFRIIQSIPSPKAEPFKRWLAKVGYERVQEIRELFRKFYFNVIPANAGILDSRFHGNDNKKGILKLCGNISSIFWPVKKMVFCMLA